MHAVCRIPFDDLLRRRFGTRAKPRGASRLDLLNPPADAGAAGQGRPASSRWIDEAQTCRPRRRGAAAPVELRDLHPQAPADRSGGSARAPDAAPPAEPASAPAAGERPRHHQSARCRGDAGVHPAPPEPGGGRRAALRAGGASRHRPPRPRYPAPGQYPLPQRPLRVRPRSRRHHGAAGRGIAEMDERARMAGPRNVARVSAVGLVVAGTVGPLLGGPCAFIAERPAARWRS